MLRVSIIAFAVTLTACATDDLRGLACSTTVPCGSASTCVEGTCQPCGDACGAPDAGHDAGYDAGRDAGEDAGTDAGPADAGPLDGGPPPANVDPACADPDAGAVFPPPYSLPDTVPASCLVGFEMNNFHGIWSIDSIPDGGASAITLEVDIATYQAPDLLRISAVESGVMTSLLETCHMQTATYGDPTHGIVAPPADAIRPFRLPIPDGTTQLTFDFTSSTTPQYIRVLGLCDFQLTPPPNEGMKWRLVSSR